ncbi:ankyrin repeat domain-containing protein [Riemerella columbina]|uniref:ankyrin repeat domain-containing protein n=1 Tax=Riemerella columbina TaxID=103810 RepID=UPI0026704B74|nr:ankyrin repeat domain-containing protein [Riemerella columbina]WKS94737.1 ankyrin repeat domain-containing protein [Riemerella columbina]
MKKYIILSLGLSVNALLAQNTLLEKNFWQNRPNVAVVKAEIAKGNSPSAANPANFDVVTQAIMQDAPQEVVLYLLQQPGNTVDKLTHDSRIYLHWAAYRGNLDLVKWLLEHQSDINHMDSKGYTPLVFGANSGLKNPALYDLFFQYGVPLHQKYKDGAEIFHYAIANDDANLTLTKYFLGKGFQLNAKDDLGRTVVDYAARSQDPELLKKLIPQGGIYTDEILLFAAKGTKNGAEAQPVFDYLIQDLKISPKTVDHEGNNLLHFLLSGRNMNETLAAEFIKQGISAEQANHEGVTPLMKAAQRNKKALVELMVQQGLKNINAVDKKGLSALSYAMQRASPEMVEYLISQGADAQIKDRKGNSLVFYALNSYSDRNKNAVSDILKKLELLKQKGIVITQAQPDGNTLAHLAVNQHSVALLEALKPYFTDINAQNEEGLTPLHLAAMQSKDMQLIEALLRLGADKNIKTSLDETAYDLAKDNEILGQKLTETAILK